MKLAFTTHAKRKIKQRNLRNAWIRKTVKNPDYSFETYNNRFKVYKKFSKLHLAVIYVVENNERVIITAHWEKDFRPGKKGDKNEN